MGWTKMQEWSKATTVALVLVTAISLAWAEFGPEPKTERPVPSAWKLPESTRLLVKATAARQLVTLNTMDPARVDQHLDAWEQATTSTQLELLRRQRAATRSQYLRERETLSAARVSTMVPISSHAGGGGRAHLMAVVRLTSTKPGGPPVEKVRRYRVFMTLTPQGWRVSGLLDTAGGSILVLTARGFIGPPSREYLMLEDARKMMAALARGEGRDVLTDSAADDYDRIRRRAGAPGRTAGGQAPEVELIRQDDESAELLVFLNLGMTETLQQGNMTMILPSERSKLALRVTIVPDGSDWRITRVRDA
ncbi:hypothetical protein BZB76_0435 [Actinomadura pelletieri DSM 43383]|uniref:Uncharacterized protein n=1 Tax=Actinomadura pelletieri DSM 43383 TaxID=1120940 RepID=A0A495QY53_9ACTN|nr:hypothetical protein [Actinomadura pelletieri]RKS78997.1 hypothetical protein BZB76_0435 [Actinomadura pelletieri DSM 43383]